MWASKPPQELAAWQRLGKLAAKHAGAKVAVAGRRSFGVFSRRLGPLIVDYSKQPIDQEILRTLVALGNESGLPTAIADLFAGAPVNTTEDRAVRHMALREPRVEAAPPPSDARERFLAFAEAVRSGDYRGFTGRPIETVVAIGIGGSHLGPELVVDALAEMHNAPQVRFLANIDGEAARRTLAGLDPATTLVVVISKSFTTLETRTNARTVASWFVERTCDVAALGRHFVAVTANADAARNWGVPAENCFPMDDAVGGRYSLWSAAGLPAAIALGRNAFEAMLAGAHRADEHFRRAPIIDNLPALLALLQIWNANFHGAATHAVLAYDHRLRLLPQYLQQLEMESNGKSIHLDGEPVATHTAPVIWGGEETNGQHAFHQLLHQGTRAFSADFIACVAPGHDLADHHDWLLANCLAQSKAMREGRTDEEGVAVANHRRIPGGHASTTVLLDELTPKTLGTLLALYEHKVFCASVIWQTNAFDQWGVELGKELAGQMRTELAKVPATERRFWLAEMLKR